MKTLSNMKIARKPGGSDCVTAGGFTHDQRNPLSKENFHGRNAERIEFSNRAFATFFVRDALCAVDAAGVQEVIRVESVTPVRHAPRSGGVMN